MEETFFTTGIDGDLGSSFLNSGVPSNPLLELTKTLEIAVESTGSLQLHAPSLNKVYNAEETKHIFSELLTVQVYSNTSVDFKLIKSLNFTN